MKASEDWRRACLDGRFSASGGFPSAELLFESNAHGNSGYSYPNPKLLNRRLGQMIEAWELARGVLHDGAAK